MSYEANEPCIVTKLEGRGLVTYHHLLTKKAYPEHKDSIWNLIPVSQKTHNDFHNHGTAYMANKYSSVMEWLLSNGWYVCELTGKWRNPKA
jgi:hypothetical protein